MRLGAILGPACLTVFLSGCGGVPEQAHYVHHQAPRAALGPEVVGRPLAAVLNGVPQAPVKRTAIAPGEETIVWLHANVHRGEGVAVWCRETVTVRGGTIADYQREGGAC